MSVRVESCLQALITKDETGTHCVLLDAETCTCENCYRMFRLKRYMKKNKLESGKFIGYAIKDDKTDTLAAIFEVLDQSGKLIGYEFNSEYIYDNMLYALTDGWKIHDLF